MTKIIKLYPLKINACSKCPFSHREYKRSGFLNLKESSYLFCTHLGQNITDDKKHPVLLVSGSNNKTYVFIENEDEILNVCPLEDE